MRSYPIETEVPLNSRIVKRMAGAHFCDSWAITSKDVGRSALEHFLTAIRQTPRWVEACMMTRNRTVQLFGVKDLGRFSDVTLDKSASDYAPGDRLGVFTVLESTFDEALFGDSDNHLDSAISIHRGESPDQRYVIVTLTTVVHIKNPLGRLYMLPVRPMHRLIVPAVLAVIGNAADTA